MKLSDLQVEKKQSALREVEEIFFMSSSLKSFSSPEKKEAFYKRWCKDYQDLYADEFFLVLEDERVLGYLSGCSNSNQALDVINVPGFSVFKDLFNNFPAHLHINFHPDARGKGLGSLLVNHYVASLRERGVSGVHLVTSPDAKNVSFYERLNFVSTVTRDFNQMPLYFMGRILE